jgi:hypothetical protein
MAISPNSNMVSAGIRNSSSSTMLGVSGGLMGQSSNSRKA